ncbi:MULTISPECIES: H-NS family nucleoid-associated regulatory protein [Xanthomonas]|uniref:H-NS histone family protein n=1 Tax=Xanthomonas TaxID=338 RepID=UPI001AD95BAD|nr:H-NS family nucleoid-associated regulatory protein [Xanthomonas phaseoli]MBO9768151.1 H-NS histone family protein [Xanthomonas phaseoli pv. dieffenbachiae]MBO9776375.1 H-NS histone family protein [Xanthomonas phaseoli pv. dieffenbachiae]MBO9778660.1 H-NS histone family protein [Xanthomonas phaseoli pv. dieffenbachiae]MBO9797910.1 H-NS histone family protein [Xanthomonas phaseoli pv. dieffenbachiae]MBO9799368.1 H-NS histone family protein [Xanthomonas phaseoli pv. dieffenbachiae]
MSIDLSGLSAKQLSALIKNAKKQQTVVAKRAPIAKVRTQLTRAAKAQGYSIEELFGASASAGPGRPAGAGKPGPRAGRKLGKVPPKYRNPANAQETWTGRGKQPRWLAELTAAGKKVEDFLISKVGGAKKATAKNASPRKAVTKRATKKSKAA